jgi:putative ABC transport system ATP-binding protein
MSPVLSLTGISKVFTRGDEAVRALSDITFSVEPGEFISITGTSGSGKSTLLYLLGLLDAPTSGTYLLDSLDVSILNDAERTRVRNKKIGFIFQSFFLLPRYNALENVALPLMYSAEALSKKEIQDRAKAQLVEVGLEDRMYHLPNQLSGGQRQRVAIARALVNSPAILLADEPTGNLDSKTSEEIIKLFFKLHDKGATILLVTHDAAIAALAHRQIILRDGRVVS